MKKSFILSIATGALLSFQIPGAVFAQDAAVANPKTVKVNLDNASVRVLETSLSPGQKEQVHSHPACVIYVISGGKVRSHLPDGKTVDGELTSGATIYREPVTHWTENIGATTVHRGAQGSEVAEAERRVEGARRLSASTQFLRSPDTPPGHRFLQPTFRDLVEMLDDFDLPAHARHSIR